MAVQGKTVAWAKVLLTRLTLPLHIALAHPSHTVASPRALISIRSPGAVARVTACPLPPDVALTESTIAFAVQGAVDWAIHRATLEPHVSHVAFACSPVAGAMRAAMAGAIIGGAVRLVGPALIAFTLARDALSVTEAAVTASVHVAGGTFPTELTAALEVAQVTGAMSRAL